jgi:hypothetical protein
MTEPKQSTGLTSVIEPLGSDESPASSTHETDSFANAGRSAGAMTSRAVSGSRPRVAVFAHTPRTREYGRRALRLLGCVPLVFLSVEELVRMGARARDLAMVLLEHDGEGNDPEISQDAKFGDLVRQAIGEQLPVLHSFAAASGSAIPGFRANDMVLPASQSFAQLCRTLMAFMRHHKVPTTEIRLAWGGHRFCVETGNVFIGKDVVQLKPEEFDLALELFFNIGTRISRTWLKTMVPAAQTLRRRPTGSAPDIALIRLRDLLNLEPVYGWELQITPGLSCRLIKVD